jgi:hypothetical protein
MNDSTSDTIKVDTARLPLLLRELRLPTIAAMWQGFTERADREGWPAARLLATLTELELAERDQRRIQRHLLEARLPPGKTLDSFDFTAVPMLSRAHVAALATGDGWIDRGGTILLFGPSGSGKSHLSAAFGHALIENGFCNGPSCVNPIRAWFTKNNSHSSFSGSADAPFSRPGRNSSPAMHATAVKGGQRPPPWRRALEGGRMHRHPGTAREATRRFPGASHTTFRSPILPPVSLFCPWSARWPPPDGV